MIKVRVVSPMSDQTFQGLVKRLRGKDVKSINHISVVCDRSAAEVAVAYLREQNVRTVLQSI